jgi:hypothetical protein
VLNPKPITLKELCKQFVADYPTKIIAGGVKEMLNI